MRRHDANACLSYRPLVSPSRQRGLLLAGVVAATFALYEFGSNQAWSDNYYRPIDSTYKLTFDDEFNGNAVDNTKWSVGWFANGAGLDGPINHYESEAYASSEVTVNNGMLSLTAISHPIKIDGKVFPYLSGLINTIGKFSQTYGYFEARICLAGQSGVISNWPAWWLVGKRSPADGELDIMEGLAGQVAYHFHSASGVLGANVVGDFAGCHLYASLWQPSEVTFYYDGNPVGSITSGITDQPQSLILNLAVGGFGGPVVVPSVMQVDYVRAWSNDPSAQSIIPQAGYDGPPVSANQPTAVPPSPTVAVALAPNLISNPGFESGTAGWATTGQAAVTSTSPRSGQMAASLSGMAGFQQVVGLKPQTSYLFSGYVRSLDGTCASLGVKHFGSRQISNCSTSPDWSLIQIPFKTGAHSELATVFYWQKNGSSTADDLDLIAR